jgi:hypothetical protein
VRCADEAGFEKSIAASLLHHADIHSLRGNHEKALELARRGLDEVRRHEVYDLACHEIAARVSRRAGLPEEGEARFAHGMTLLDRFPVMRAMMLQEGSRLAWERSDRGVAELRCAEANGIFTEMGLVARVGRVPLFEYGSIPDRPAAVRPGSVRILPEDS